MYISDRYEIQGDPIAGGMGVVYRCKDKTLSRDVAIKLIQKTSDQRRIIDELSSLLKMRSKHVVQVYDFFKASNGSLAIVEEFIDGFDLFDERARPKNKREYLNTLWQISSGLSDMHDLGVIHRDIKPNNMKIDGEGVLKIFDFGLSRLEGSSASTIGFVGTPGFAAPELYQNNPRFTTAVDVFAFGSVAFYLMTGRFLSSFFEFKSEEIHAERKPFSALKFFDISEDLNNSLNACMSFSKEDRPSIKDIRELISRELLFDTHRALVVYGENYWILDKDSRSVKLSAKDMGEVVVRYDGFCFKVSDVLGDVFVNNKPAKEMHEIPGSCVVTLGSKEKKFDRKYITFDLSNPEIVL